MESFETYVLLNASMIPSILINFAIALVLLVGVRILIARFSHVQGRIELAEKDNGAYGISLAGVVIGVIIMTTGIMTDEATLDLNIMALMMAGYGVLGVAMMFLARALFDKLALPRFSVRDEIIRGNLAAATVDAGNVIASALVVRASMYWVNGYSWQGLGLIVLTYALAQLFLTLVVRFGLARFSRRYRSTLQTQLEQGNMAVAMQFSGFRIGTALAITAASELVPYAYDAYLMPLVSWVILSLIMVVMVHMIAWLADRVILADINLDLEVNTQSNLAVGVMQGAIHVAVGLLMVALML